MAGARRRPARRGQERGQLAQGHPDHQLGARAGLEARSRASGGARLPPRHAATRSAPNPRAYPAHPRLDHAGEEENRRKGGEKSEIWPCASITATAAAATGAACPAALALVRPIKALRAIGTISVVCATAAALSPDLPRLTASPPPRCPPCRRSAATPRSRRTAPPTLPDNPYVTRASPARVLQPKFSSPNSNAPSFGWLSPTCYTSCGD